MEIRGLRDRERGVRVVDYVSLAQADAVIAIAWLMFGAGVCLGYGMGEHDWPSRAPRLRWGVFMLILVVVAALVAERWLP